MKIVDSVATFHVIIGLKSNITFMNECIFTEDHICSILKVMRLRK